MSFAEVILRIGVSFVSWLVIYMHFVMLLVVRVASCPGADTSAWRVSMISGALAFVAALSVRYGHGVSGMGAVLRYFALPLLIFLPWCAWTALPYLTGTTFGALGVCEVRLGEFTGIGSTIWQRFWAPLQLIVLTVLAYTGWRVWRDRGRPVPPAS